MEPYESVGQGRGWRGGEELSRNISLLFKNLS